MKNSGKEILVLVFLLAILLPASAAKPNKKISEIHPGMELSTVKEIMGESSDIQGVNYYVFTEMGRVVVKNNKIKDIRLPYSEKYSPPLWTNRENSRDANANVLRYLRIGDPETKIGEIAGKPDQVIMGQDWYYLKGKHVLETSEGRVLQVDSYRETGLSRLDWVKLNFSSTSLLIMNITLAFIMFGVALQIKPENFKQVIKEPKPVVLGIFGQFLALPALTFLMVYFIKPTPSVALGMILVASCPGGNISNFMSSLAKGNAALSISLTAFATVAAVFMTPVNFAFWGNLYSETANMVIPIRIDFIEILRTVLLLLGAPVVAGIWFAKKFPHLTGKIIKPVQKSSMLIFIVFVVMALLGNFDFFKSYIHLIIFIVLGHNALALLTGFTIGTLGKTSKKDRRSLTIETGIQNSGLGLVLIFNPRLFDGLGGMAFIAAWWGIWHIISGLTMAYLWSKKELPSESPETVEVSSEL